MPISTVSSLDDEITAPSLVDLAAKISLHAKKISHHLTEHNLPQPSFDRDGPSSFPVPETATDIHASRLALIEAAKTIYDLALGPEDWLGWTAMNYKYETATLRALNHYSIPSAVPTTPDGASFIEIAATTNLPVDFVTRIIRFATTSRIFREHRTGWVSHTAASLVLAQNTVARHNLTHNLDDAWVSAAKLNEAVEKGGDGPNETAFNVAFDTDLDFWRYIAQPGQEERRKAFHGSMDSWTQGGAYKADHLANGGVQWGDIQDGGVVVDIGGSQGHVSATLARRYPQLQFIVQDLGEVVAAAKKGPIAEELGDRITFMEHSFMNPQPLQTYGADVFFMRWIMHDWSDRYCEKILRNIIPAMKPGSRIVIMEAILPPAGSDTPTVVEKLQRSVDLQMMVMLNARERSQDDWERLFANTDKRLRVLRFTTPPQSALGVIEVSIDLESNCSSQNGS